MASDRASHPPSNRCAFNPFPASPQYHLIYPQLSVPERTIAPKVYLAAASPRASLPCASQSAPALRTPENPFPAHPRASLACVPQSIPALRTPEHTSLCTPVRPSASHHSAPLYMPPRPRKSCRATPQTPACLRCLRRLLERDFDPRGRQAHPRNTAQPQPPGAGDPRRALRAQR